MATVMVDMQINKAQQCTRCLGKFFHYQRATMCDLCDVREREYQEKQRQRYDWSSEE